MPYTYHRGSDGCDATFDIMTPSGEHLVSVHFWDEVEEAEARARLIVDALNSPALELLRAMLPYAEQEARMLGVLGEPKAEKAWGAVKAARDFVDAQAEAK